MKLSEDPYHKLLILCDSSVIQATFFYKKASKVRGIVCIEP